MGARFNAFYGSDIGHWDVVDMAEVFDEASELLDRGLVSEVDFRDFVFTHPVNLWTSGNPEFFEGTAVGDAVAALHRESR